MLKVNHVQLVCSLKLKLQFISCKKYCPIYSVFVSESLLVLKFKLYYTVLVHFLWYSLAYECRSLLSLSNMTFWLLLLIGCIPQTIISSV